MSPPMAELVERRGPFPVRFRVAQVQRVEQLTPRMKRIVVGGPDLEGFHTEAPDDHVKLAFPIDDASGAPRLVLPEIGPRGPVFPEGPRSPLRDYTPRCFDADTLELTLDFVMHGLGGPAVTWASRAAPGDRLGIGGPRGSLIVSDAVERFVLVGDATALPAIARRLAELPAGKEARVIVAVADAEEEQELESRASVEVEWVHGEDPAAVVRAASALELPPAPFFAWIAGESGMMRAVRDALLERGAQRELMRASGYWKLGAADHRE